MDMHLKSLAILALSIGAVSTTFSKEYDLVINDGRVMDPETMYDAVSNVGINDGRIVVITKDNIKGKERIDAKGLVVAPGFVDLHTHGSTIPFSQKLHLRDGVTTALDNEIGAYPVDVFYKSIEGQSRTNYGATVSLAGIRMTVSNPKYKSQTGNFVWDLLDKRLQSYEIIKKSARFVPDAKQVNRINAMVEEGLHQGALGIGVPVGYMTKSTTSSQMVEWQRLASKYDVATFLHGRFSSQMPPTSGILGIQEMLSSAGIYGGGLLVQHIHSQTLADTPQALKMIDDARAKGIKVQAEIYPYNFGSTVVGAAYLVPGNYGPNMGRRYKDIIEVATMKPLTKERYEELVRTEPSANVLFYGISEEGMLDALAHPSTLVGGDATPMIVKKTGMIAIDWDIAYKDVLGHPRAAGSHAKVLRLAREKNLMPLMLAISKMSYMPAQFMQENGVNSMAHKGRLKVGADADITVFDPKTVKDNATMEKGGLPSTGIPYVVVNGTIVVKDSKVIEDVYPGRPVRNALLK